jgi:hypothetical protein
MVRAELKTGWPYGIPLTDDRGLIITETSECFEEAHHECDECTSQFEIRDVRSSSVNGAWPRQRAEAQWKSLTYVDISPDTAVMMQRGTRIFKLRNLCWQTQDFPRVGLHSANGARMSKSTVDTVL